MGGIILSGTSIPNGSITGVKLSSEAVTFDKVEAALNTKITYLNSFMKATLDANDWTETIGGAGAVTENTAANTVDLTSAAVNGNAATLDADNIFHQLNAGTTLTLEWRMKLTNYNANTFYIACFLANNYVEMRHQNTYTAETVIVRTMKASSHIDTAEVPVTTLNAWHTYKLVLTATEVTLYQDDVALISQSSVANLPDNVALHPRFNVKNNDGATDCKMEIDWMRYTLE